MDKAAELIAAEAAPRIWRQETGEGPLVATAVHDGHALRDELISRVQLGEAERLREEDPFTGRWTTVAPTRVIGLRSRFEVDLNRPRDKAVYRTPEDCWGLTVWKDALPSAVVGRSQAQYDRFHLGMHELLTNIARRHGVFVVFDLHSYNHRRNGPHADPADPEGNPQVNIGTGSVDRGRWGAVVDAFIESLRDHEFPGGRLDVRENVKFQGGHWPRWIHANFPGAGLALAIEFKKFFMDEWTGAPDLAMVDAIGKALEATVAPTLAAVERL